MLESWMNLIYSDDMLCSPKHYTKDISGILEPSLVLAPEYNVVVVVVARVTQFVVNDTFAKTSLHISRSQFNIFSKLSSVLRQHIDMRSK